MSKGRGPPECRRCTWCAGVAAGTSVRWSGCWTGCLSGPRVERWAAGSIAFPISVQGGHAEWRHGIDRVAFLHLVLPVGSLVQALHLHLVQDVPHRECVGVERLANRRERPFG